MGKILDFITGGIKHKGQHAAGKHAKGTVKQPRIPKSKKGKK